MNAGSAPFVREVFLDLPIHISHYQNSRQHYLGGSSVSPFFGLKEILPSGIDDRQILPYRIVEG
jgi:hypothetical protein